ncbi:3D (Asp-Asp-Asp) domain-containing protein [Paenibacillus sp. 1_12]|uniref:3D domain-containing protein n=1 Tax=Paenibacillus sp. 1_12 TaxID=1566278 RepID=UPI0008EB8A8A|nr:3D domain-containing protein [Paenibacillus sp. 1_12]SFL94526.1 3D (Asp-Asp-Asp) domain-containing protein [Paenibacillus sp. 1_12]
MDQRNIKSLYVLLFFCILGLKLDLHSYASSSWELNAASMAESDAKADSTMNGPVWEPSQQSELEDVQRNQPKRILYQVNEGDTLEHIAQQFGNSVNSLAEENQLEPTQLLAAGQQLHIPAAEAVIPIPDDQPKVISQVMSSTLTAYTAGKESTGKSEGHPEYGITFSGSKAEEGRTIAVDPAVIPIGTEVFIDGVGIRTAEDTGSAVRGARIDVFMNDVGEALEFGVKRNVKVYVLSASR